MLQREQLGERYEVSNPIDGSILVGHDVQVPRLHQELFLADARNNHEPHVVRDQDGASWPPTGLSLLRETPRGGGALLDQVPHQHLYLVDFLQA